MSSALVSVAASHHFLLCYVKMVNDGRSNRIHAQNEAELPSKGTAFPSFPQHITLAPQPPRPRVKPVPMPKARCDRAVEKRRSTGEQIGHGMQVALRSKHLRAFSHFSCLSPFSFTHAFRCWIFLAFLALLDQSPMHGLQMYLVSSFLSPHPIAICWFRFFLSIE